MKVLIISDIHSDFDSFYKVINQESFDKLVFLGDLFSYGADFDEIDNNDIYDAFVKLKDKLLIIKGNCDYLIDYDKFNLYAHDVFSMTINNHVTTFTHGHIYSKGFLPDYHGDIFISGHTHVPELTKENGIIYANPGSIGRPRGLSKKGYLVFEEDKLILKTIDNEIIKEMVL